MADGRWTVDASRARRKAALALYEVRTLSLVIESAERRLSECSRLQCEDSERRLDDALRKLDQAQTWASMLQGFLVEARDATRHAIGRHRGDYQRRNDE